MHCTRAALSMASGWSKLYSAAPPQCSGQYLQKASGPAENLQESMLNSACNQLLRPATSWRDALGRSAPEAFADSSGVRPR